MKNKTLILTILLLTSCSRPEQITLHFSEASLVSKPALPEKAKTIEKHNFLYPEDKEIEHAVKKFKQSGKAPIIKETGFLRFPYGESEPVIRCQPLRACDVELEVGEEIMGLALGDTVRWEVLPVVSGGKKGLKPHLIIKPRDFDISTNLIVTTSKRTYHLALLSDKADYVRQFKFYYPGEMLRNFKSQNLAREKVQRSTISGVKAESLNFNYKIRGKEYFRPKRVFDDGEKVYLEFPEIVKRREAPVLLVKNGRDTELVNYRVKGRFYQVDKLFSEAVLVLGVGRSRKIVRVERK